MLEQIQINNSNNNNNNNASSSKFTIALVNELNTRMKKCTL